MLLLKSLILISKLIFSKQIFWKQYQSVMRHSVGPDLDPNCLQGSAADGESIAAGRQRVMYMYIRMFVFVFLLLL